MKRDRWYGEVPFNHASFSQFSEKGKYGSAGSKRGTTGLDDVTSYHQTKRINDVTRPMDFDLAWYEILFAGPKIHVMSKSEVIDYDGINLF